jgi:hypothetical protein
MRFVRDEVTLGHVVFEICHFSSTSIFTEKPILIFIQILLFPGNILRLSKHQNAISSSGGEALDRTALSLLSISFQRINR